MNHHDIEPIHPAHERDVYMSHMISEHKAHDRRRSIMAGLAEAFAQTDECGEILRALVPVLLKRWAGGSRLKNGISCVIQRHVEKSFQPAKGLTGEPVITFFEDMDLSPALSEQLPAMVNGALKTLETVIRNIEKRSPEDKALLLGAFLQNIRLSSTGRILTGLARILVDIHKTAPLFFSEKIEPKFKDWLEETDFGELKESLDSSAEDMAAFFTKANEILWQYPAKVVCLLSFIPTLLNMIITALKESAVHLNRVSPELQSDILFSLLRDMRGDEAGRMVNEFNELVRKIHTGSALLGGPDNPQLSREVTRLAHSIVKEIDTELFIKSTDSLTHMKETCLDAFLNALESCPELLRYYLRRHFRLAGGRIRSWNRKAEILGDSLSHDDIALEVSKGLAELDIQDLAETVNRLCSLFNNAPSMGPVPESNLLPQFIGALDIDELDETVERITDDAVQSLKPVARVMMPHFIRGLGDLLRPDDEEEGHELNQALAALRKVISGEEAGR